MKMTTGGPPRKQMSKDEQIEMLKETCSMVEQDNIKLREQVKNLGLFSVSQQRGLLVAFTNWENEQLLKGVEFESQEDAIEIYLATNCG